MADTRMPDERPYWSHVLRALREARGITQEGWAARLGIARSTLLRWEYGKALPDAIAEQALVALCQERGLFRSYAGGPLAGLTLTEAWLRELLAGARLGRSEEGSQPPAAAEPVRAGGVASPARLQTNLPAAVTSFVGRERELAEVRRLLTRTRLLTLMGAGGVGKTRVALEAARTLVERYSDGVWLVELAALTDAKLVSTTVAGVLGINEVADRQDLESLVETLRTRRLLLVLDNCEHLVEACARLVDSLLRACEAVTVLATSRTALGIAGETRFRVPSLAMPDELSASTGSAGLDRLTHVEAVQLFVDRAAAVQPGFALTPGNAEAVAQICRQLDGIPLALELAAGRLAVLSAEQIAARLADRFRLLVGGNRTALPRQRTLRATVEWSYDLLSEPERVLFRRLAVFAGTWAIEATEAVCTGEGREGADVLNLLEQLVDKSMVAVATQQEAARYHMLETLRQFAADRLDAAGEAAATRARHLAWYLDFAELAAARSRGPEQSWWMEQLELEHDNLRLALATAVERGAAVEALRLAISLGRFWLVRGHFSEWAEWTERVLRVSAGMETRLRAQALRQSAELERRRGAHEQAMAHLTESLALCRTLDDAEGIGDSLLGLGLAAAEQGEHGEARARLLESLAHFRTLDHALGVASALANLGLVASAQGDHGQAVAWLEESLDLFRRLGNTRGVANALDNLGNAALAQGDPGRAATYYGESLSRFAELGDHSGLIRCVEGLAAVAVAQGEPVRSARLLGGAEALRAALGLALSPAERARHEGTVAAVCTALPDPSSLAAACAEGRSLTRDDLRALARGGEPTTYW